MPGAPQNTVPGGAGLWVFGGKKPAEYRAVAKFFSFLLQPDEQARWHQRTGYLPVTRQAYELSPQGGLLPERPGQEIALRQLAAAPTPDSRGIRLGDYRWIRAIFDEELEAVWFAGSHPQGRARPGGRARQRDAAALRIVQPRGEIIR